ncbi:hypothetical protein BGX26_000634 [Mortierella sp. AD094]|nr:hypothetical protein BGX26_000634 [Mortierella sp. AD094]
MNISKKNREKYSKYEYDTDLDGIEAWLRGVVDTADSVWTTKLATTHLNVADSEVQDTAESTNIDKAPQESVNSVSLSLRQGGRQRPYSRAQRSGWRPQKQLVTRQEQFQKSHADQMTAQQEQVLKQFEELKNILLRPLA